MVSIYNRLIGQLYEVNNIQWAVYNKN